MPSSHYNSFPSSSQVVGTFGLFSHDSPTHRHLASSVDGRFGLDTYYSSSSLISPSSSLHRSGYPSSAPPSTPATPFIATIPLPALASPQPRHLLGDVFDTWKDRLEGSSTSNRLSPLQPNVSSMLRNLSTSPSSARSSPTLLNESSSLLFTNDFGMRLPAPLIVNVGTGGTFSWVAAKPDIAHFFALHDRSNTLEITWRPSSLDSCNELGYSFLQKLFRYLTQDEQSHEMTPSLPPASMLFSRQMAPPIGAGPIRTFEQVSITVPEHVDLDAVENFEGPQRGLESSVCIDLSHASRLQEFAWEGDFSFLVNNLKRIPLSQLTKLSISGCLMSVNDTLALMDQCTNLEEGTFDTIGEIEGTLAGTQDVLKPRELPYTFLPKLVRLELATNTSLVSVFKQLECAQLASLSLKVYREEHDILEALTALSANNLDSLSVTANLTDARQTKLRTSYPMAEIYPFHSW